MLKSFKIGDMQELLKPSALMEGMHRLTTSRDSWKSPELYMWWD